MMNSQSPSRKESPFRDSFEGNDSFEDLSLNADISHYAASKRHRRSGSINSGISSLASSSFLAPSSAGLHIPTGFNTIGGESLLGSNSISELVDGHDRSDDNGLKSANRRTAAFTSTSVVPFRAPTTKDIPPVVLTKIPKLQREEFNHYISDITQDYDTFFGIKFAGGDHGASGGDDLHSIISYSMSNMSLGETSVNISADQTLDHENLDISPAEPDSISTDPQIASLSTIPDVFFSEDFKLDNPRVFDIVSERSQIVKEDESTSGLAIKVTNATDDPAAGNATGISESKKILLNNSILQEKLSWYIDTVELHLIREISNASTSFFSALDDLKGIQTSSAAIVERTKNIKKALEAVDRTLAVNSIRNLKLHQRRENVAKLGQTLDQLSLILEKSDDAESSLLGRNDAASCMDIIDGVEALISGTNDSKNFVKSWTEGWIYPISDVRSVKGLDGLRESLVRLRTRAGESYSTLFTNLLMQDLTKHVETVSTSDTMDRLSEYLHRGKSMNSEKTVKNKRYLDVDPEFREKLQKMVQGLVRSGNALSAIKEYRESVIKKAKDEVRIVLPSRDDDDSSISSNMTGTRGGGGSSLAQSLRELSPRQVEKMLLECYSSLSELFRRLLTQQKVLLDTILSMGDIPAGVMEINEIMPSAVGISQTRISKVLKVRREQVAALDMHQFLRYYSLNGMFISECEALCGDPCEDLSGVLAVQIKTFITSFHARQERFLTEKMNKDTWKEVEISQNFQNLVDLIISAEQNDPPTWTSLILEVLNRDLPEPNGEGQLEKSETKSIRQRPKNVFAGEKSFIISNGAIEVITLTTSYMEAAVLLPHLSGDMVNNLLGLLRQFNTLTNQLILGAGATRTAGLKHITAKHLALASESLGFVAYMTESIQKFFQRNVVNQSQALLPEFSTVAEGLRKHQEEIHQKFITLMSDKINMHCAVILKTDWGLPVAKQPPVHKYMEDLIKETSILVKIMRSILPKETYLLIISRIFDIYKRQLLDAYTKVEFKSSVEKKSMLQDLEMFKERLGNVEGSGNCADVLYENINAMPAPEPEDFFDAGDAHDGHSTSTPVNARPSDEREDDTKQLSPPTVPSETESISLGVESEVTAEGSPKAEVPIVDSDVEKKGSEEAKGPVNSIDD